MVKLKVMLLSRTKFDIPNKIFAQNF